MSGILGVFHIDGAPASPKTLRRGLQAMAHRGPDGMNVWANGPVGLAHAALHTTPEAIGQVQPLVDTERGLAVTADARIDNRDDLIRQLGLRGAPSSRTTDTALILEAYARWGSDAPGHLVGDFAFALWDGKRRRFVCARDHIGVRPLYVAQREGVVAVASEIDALLALGVASDAINEAWIAAYLARSFGEGTETAYRDVHRLRPAHVAWYGFHGVPKQKAYWSLDPNQDMSPRSDAAYVEKFRALFSEAVRCRLRAPDPVGSHVSGGLDSTSVAAVARDALLNTGRPHLHTYAATFPGYDGAEREAIDERPFIEAFERDGGVSSRHVELGTASAFDGLKTIVASAGQPSFTYNAYMMCHLLQAAEEDGVRVLLDGIEGDIAVSHGNNVFIELGAQGRWDELQTMLTQHEVVHGFTSKSMVDAYGPTLIGLHAMHHHWREVARGAYALSAHADVSPLRLAWRFGVKPHLPDGVQTAWNSFRGASPEEPLLTPELRALLPDDDDSPHRTEREAHAASVVHPGVATFLEEGDHYAAAHGVESRHPFYDVRLIEYCVSLPPHMKLRNGWTRFILREAMRNVLPEAVRTRASKGILTPNFLRGVLDRGMPVVDGLFTPEAKRRLSPFLNLPALESARRNGDAHVLWTAVQLSTWLDRRETRASVPTGPAPASSFAPCISEHKDALHRASPLTP